MKQKKAKAHVPIKLEELTPEQKKALFLELEAEQKQQEQQQRQERQGYKQLVDGEVKRLYPALAEASKTLSMVKEYVFDALKGLISTKAELYDREDDQNRHSFSTIDGNITIEIGYIQQDNWDDTVNTGISKVNDYMTSLVTTENKNLVEVIMKLLSKDSKGNLKASRVLMLKQMADKSGDEGFIDAINIIQDAYKPTRSKEFIRCTFKDAKGEKIILPLGITEAPFGEQHPLGKLQPWLPGEK